MGQISSNQNDVRYKIFHTAALVTLHVSLCPHSLGSTRKITLGHLVQSLALLKYMVSTTGLFFSCVDV